VTRQAPDSAEPEKNSPAARPTAEEQKDRGSGSRGYAFLGAFAGRAAGINRDRSQEREAMSISRPRFLLALVASTMLVGPTFAEELAKTVAAKLKEVERAGALAGYRVTVKAKSGTVWLEGTVSDDKQLAAALGVTEATPGVERVVNRLVVQPQQAPAAATPLGMPTAAWSMAGIAAPAQLVEQALESAPPAEKKPSRNPLAAMAETLFFKQPVDEQPIADQVQLVQATAPSPRGRTTTGRGAASGRQQAVRPPLALPQPAGRPLRSPHVAQAGNRTALRTSGPGETLSLPAPGGFEGTVADGQMVPGTMRYSEGVPANAMPGGMPGGMPGNGVPMAGGPMPMGTTGVGMPPVPMRGDGPNMPNYAWPSYAAYPNYAALQYPTQYSPTAWPYIGPFYPYPQVPLGWRRVSLEWDDGWWFLDFDERHYHSHHR